MSKAEQQESQPLLSEQDQEPQPEPPHKADLPTWSELLKLIYSKTKDSAANSANVINSAYQQRGYKPILSSFPAKRVSSFFKRFGKLIIITIIFLSITIPLAFILPEIWYKQGFQYYFDMTVNPYGSSIKEVNSTLSNPSWTLNLSITNHKSAFILEKITIDIMTEYEAYGYHYPLPLTASTIVKNDVFIPHIKGNTQIVVIDLANISYNAMMDNNKFGRLVKRNCEREFENAFNVALRIYKYKRWWGILGEKAFYRDVKVNCADVPKFVEGLKGYK